MYVCSNCGNVITDRRNCNNCHSKNLLFIGSNEFLEWHTTNGHRLSYDNFHKIRAYIDSLDFDEISKIKQYQNELDELSEGDIYEE